MIRQLNPVRLLALLAFAAGWPLAAAEVDYLRDIKPLLTEKCVSCHGAVKQEGGLRLDAAALVRNGGSDGLVVDPEQPADSELLRRVTATDDERMPPPEEGERLRADQVELLRQWISAGLPAPADEPITASPREHWAFRPIRQPALPPGTTASNPIDTFVDAQLTQRGVQPLPATDSLTLLRRATLDVIGLPPDADEVQRVCDDPAGWSYDQTIDRLLASPQYGERWGRHWMDVWRYSDWDGFKNELRGSQRHIWRWRDWIIESLNADKPYDRMIVEMLAGDEVAPLDPATLRATGFLARNYHNSNRDIWLDATVEHTLKAFVGLTVNCARCHDHKYDPIPQTDYYAVRAIFEPHRVRTERLPGIPDINQDGLPRVLDLNQDALTYVYVRGNEKQPDKEHPVSPGVPEFLGLPLEVSPVSLPREASLVEFSEAIEREDVAIAEAAVKKAHEKLAGCQAAAKEAAVERQSASARPPSPALPQSVSVEEELAGLQSRAAEAELESLQARWEADRAKHAELPLCPEQVEALAQTASEAERRQKWLAARLVAAQKWEALQKAEAMPADKGAAKTSAVEAALKALVAAEADRARARSALAKGDSQYTPVGVELPATSTGRRLGLARWIISPENPLTARVAVNHVWMRHFGQPLVPTVFDFGLQAPQPIQAELLDWLAAELVESGWSLKHIHRLILTSEVYRRASSGETSLMAHNASIDPDNRLLWRSNVQRLDAEVVRDNLWQVAGRLDATFGGPDLDDDLGEKLPRRSLYFRHAYEKQMTMLTLFDAPSPNECYRRSPSITPQQALVLSNSGLSRTAAEAVARDIGPERSNEEFVRDAFVRVLSRPPEGDELKACREFLSRAEEQEAAREQLVHVLLNHNDFVTVR